MVDPSGAEKVVAVKFLQPALALQGRALERLKEEGKILRQLHHPSIPAFYDQVLLEGRPALVTELVEGFDLADRIDRIPPRALLELLAEVAKVLADATVDGRQLVHRDLKPSNIRIDHGGRVKLLDFGVARFGTDRETLTASEELVGSVPYLAPERFLSPDVEPASDVFALGCCLFEGLAKDRFYGDLGVGAIAALAHDEGRYAVFFQERLHSFAFHPLTLGLLADLLSREPSYRPSAAEAHQRLLEAAPLVDGPGLRAWWETQEPAEPTTPNGPLEGRVLVEGDAPPEPPATSQKPTVHTTPVETVDEQPAPCLPHREDPGPPVPAPPAFVDVARELLPIGVGALAGLLLLSLATGGLVTALLWTLLR